jgi:hypothetical protein
MTIRQVITLAQNGELNNIATKNNMSAIIGHLNLGLIEMYKRFPLNVQEYMITLEAGKDIYQMPEDYMWIVAAYDEVPTDSDAMVSVIPINEEDNPLSLNTVGFNQIQIPVIVNGGHVSIIYIAAPPVYDYIENTDSFTKTYYDHDADDMVTVAATVLDIPTQMIEALLHYVGYRAHSSMDSGTQAENNGHYTRFETSCLRLEQRGMINNDDLSMKDRVVLKGFV